MKLTKLFKKATNGKTQQWEIEIVGNQYRTHEGGVGEKITTGVWTTCEGKNIGKANETTPEAQALKDATAKHKKKTEKGYTENIEDVAAAQFLEPMRADKLDDYPVTDDQFPFFMQPKLDGIRCIIDKTGMWTRTRKPIRSCPHIMDALHELLETLPDGVYLDGELYNHDLKEDFEEICSIVKQVKPTQEDFDKSERLMQFHCYDITDTANRFAVRNTVLQYQIPDSLYIRVVPTVQVHNRKEMKAAYDKYMKLGYEGAMIRFDTVYEWKRTKNLLKMKVFVTDEFKIVDITAGKGIKADKAARCVFNTADGKEFEATPEGSHVFCRRLLVEKESLIGKLATVKYIKLTKDGVPKHANVTAIRDYE